MSNYIKNAIGHTKVVLRHKRLVLKFMCMAGYPIGGLMHDMSKFHPVEFIESVKYYNGGKSSPIGKAVKEKGYSKAKLHHRHNKHHIDYWLNELSYKDIEPEPLLIPKRYAVEMLCDWIAAGIVYQGERWNWHHAVHFTETIGSRYRLHPLIFEYLLYMSKRMEDEQSFECIKEARVIYDQFINQLQN